MAIRIWVVSLVVAASATMVVAQAANTVLQDSVKRDVQRSDSKAALDRHNPGTNKMAGTFVDCPLEYATTEVGTRLAEPWWSPPQRGELVDTHVTNVGGIRSLICNYAAYNKTMPVLREVPSRYHSCTAVTGGFRCY